MTVINPGTPRRKEGENPREPTPLWGFHCHFLLIWSFIYFNSIAYDFFDCNIKFNFYSALIRSNAAAVFS